MPHAGPCPHPERSISGDMAAKMPKNPKTRIKTPPPILDSQIQVFRAPCTLCHMAIVLPSHTFRDCFPYRSDGLRLRIGWCHATSRVALNLHFGMADLPGITPLEKPMKRRGLRIALESALRVKAYVSGAGPRNLSLYRLRGSRYKCKKSM